VPLLALAVVFVVVPLVELYVILKVGDAIGIGWTLLILVADSVLGSALLKSQGRAVWRRFNEAVQAGRVPHGEIIDGVLIIFGGAFLITPGFVTDVFGLLFLLPPTRAAIRRVARRTIERRAVVRVGGAAYRHVRDERAARDYDVDGTATEADGPGTPRLER
jgi:UPF0716 protein FxsA